MIDVTSFALINMLQYMHRTSSSEVVVAQQEEGGREWIRVLTYCTTQQQRKNPLVERRVTIEKRVFLIFFVVVRMREGGWGERKEG